MDFATFMTVKIMGHYVTFFDSVPVFNNLLLYQIYKLFDNLINHLIYVICNKEVSFIKIFKN